MGSARSHLRRRRRQVQQGTSAQFAAAVFILIEFQKSGGGYRAIPRKEAKTQVSTFVEKEGPTDIWHNQWNHTNGLNWRSHQVIARSPCKGGRKVLLGPIAVDRCRGQA
ncbi:hypothetical protein IFM46972_10753 [Aspergillus udagawae]|uniref:Uncharacterized protein n=1 Tax=Aspergillus udagawae TaxID=91492 RepID=A0A8H3SDZ3_9EURO|nr:hypothetical protein IFM46972_10753 [Aspergillus udagawae]